MKKAKYVYLSTLPFEFFNGAISDIITELRNKKIQYENHGYYNINLKQNDFDDELRDIELWGSRPETDIEFAVRQKKEQKYKEGAEKRKFAAKEKQTKIKQQKEKELRKQYEKLKEMFE